MAKQVFKDDGPVHIVTFVSRNKDNKDVEGFVERRKSILTHEERDSEFLKREFQHFRDDGQPGEFSRMYYSVNSRDMVKTHQELVSFLATNPNFDLCRIRAKTVGIAQTHPATKHWLFDFDIDDEKLCNEFCEDILKIDRNVEITINKTPHGYGVVVSRGFDTRELYKKWDPKQIGLMRDDLVCVMWDTKKEIDLDVLDKTFDDPIGTQNFRM